MSWVHDFSTEGNDNLTVDLGKDSATFHFEDCCSSLDNAQVKVLHEILTVWLARNTCRACGGTGYTQPDVAIEVCDCAKPVK